MTILAFGCSVTHGLELVTTWASDENVALSYPSLVANHLKVDCENWAFAGNSNENIFHKAMEIIPNTQNITAVIVGWTSPLREVWEKDGRIWQFIPSWCGTLVDITKPVTFVKEPDTSWSDDSPRRVSDSEEYIDILADVYKVLTKYKWDNTEYVKKRSNYITAIRTHCSLHNIRLIETQWYPLDKIKDINLDLCDVGPWLSELRHPNIKEHEMIAEMIIENYKL
jgi:hypothetical protein